MNRIWSFFKKQSAPDYFLIACVSALTVFGLVILASASSDLGKLKFNNSYHFLFRQVINGLSVGILGFLVGLYMPYQNWKKLAIWMMIVNIIALGLLYTDFAQTIRGSRRWMQIGPVNFQPSELLKISFLIYLSAWISNTKANREHSFQRGLVPLLVVCGLVGGLLVFQPATSTVAILFTASAAILFAGGMKWKHIGILVAIGLSVVAILTFATPYRMKRVLTFINPQGDVSGSGFHVEQAKTAIGSGGITGVGYGKSIAKVTFLPTPVDDSIFAVAAQELGFIGSSFLIALYFLLSSRMMLLARRVKDKFGKLILIGFAVLISTQVLVHIGSISGLLPPTGVPLPFVSYGGTALAVFLTISGIAANVSRSA